jgi:hypothetical protein
MVQESPAPSVRWQVVPNTEKGGFGVVVMLEMVTLFDRPLHRINPP